MLKELEDQIKALELNQKDLRLLEQEKQAAVSAFQAQLKPYDRVQLARHETRPKAKDFIEELMVDPVYLHGDRLFGDDDSIIGGIGYLGDVAVTFIGTQKGKCLEEYVVCNFGMPKPEGYRKALRLMKQAEKFNRPIITFVDTPGAYPGIDAEERGQGEAIARNILEMGRLKVPVISVVTGEGGSGGALALAVANKILMMENSVFSILSPEGFASILWKDGSRYEEATEVMKLTAKDLYDYEIVDRVIKEDIAFSLDGFKANFVRLKQGLIEELAELLKKKPDQLVRQRQDKFRKMGGGY